ncbi:MAG: NADH-quinone oxidoreductase subunit L [Planctomycetota bacterium]
MVQLLDNSSIYYILWFAPLTSFVIQIFFGTKLPRKGDFVSILTCGLSLVLSFLLFIAVLIKNNVHFRFVPAPLEWLKIGDTVFPFGFYVDNLTIFMVLVVCIVSFLVHLYSVGYMHNDRRYSRFYAYLSLFTFSMLGLVLSNNLVFLFIFWELVGLSSYLLIGFWFEKDSAANACIKAFLTTKLADLCFLIGILFFYIHGKSFLYSNLLESGYFGREQMGGIPSNILTIGSLLLFLGAMGKSAQFPFHIWLPDAMEGPTPVSALIHAATMVAAGVFMVCRLFYLFTDSSLLVIAYIGGFTTCFASTMGIVANDFKRILAYSTISQLGFMMLALGTGALQGGFFHLWTHAYFKALLFLCAGSVIHALHTNNIFEMGGLKKYMPLTFITMLIGTLAIMGLPPYLISGFFSKDQIVAGVLDFVYKNNRHFLLGILCFLSVFLTAFYMTRLVVIVFFNRPEKEYEHKPAESPKSMTIPLIVLAILSIISGWGGYIEHLVPNLKYETFTQHFPAQVHLAAIVGSFAFALAGILFSLLFYHENFQIFSPEKWQEKFKGIYNLLFNRYYIDDKIVKGLIIDGLLKFENILAKFDLLGLDKFVDNTAEFARSLSKTSGNIDTRAVDATVDALGNTVLITGDKIRAVQTGNIKQYISWVLGGAISLVIIAFIISKWFTGQ